MHQYIKAELQTERQRLVLFDNTAAAIPTLQPGAAHDFTVEHDLKELGAHTLVCSTVYTDVDGVSATVLTVSTVSHIQLSRTRTNSSVLRGGQGESLVPPYTRAPPYTRGSVSLFLVAHAPQLSSHRLTPLF